MTDTDIHHPVFARIYPWVGRQMEAHGLAEKRDLLLEGLEGRVVEVGAGNGLNLPHYPADVSDLVAVEPEPHLRALAEEAAGHVPFPVRVVDAVAADLPVEDGAFDAAVISLVLCSVEDQAAALVELFRVVRPGGELRFLEHVAARTAGLGLAQRALDASRVWALGTGGCHVARHTAVAIADAGFRIERIQRFRFPRSPTPWPTAPHILGVARRP